MARDFTVSVFKSMLDHLIRDGYYFQTLRAYLKEPAKKVVILRHDVDRMPFNSLITARIENSLGITGTYYFRSGSKGFNTGVIREIERLGHEIGYHYEDLGTVKGMRSGNDKMTNLEKRVLIAIERFRENLASLRSICDVETICMHGSPFSRYDSRYLWKYFDYSDFKLFGEPYFDIDLEEMLYLTDTGRRWNHSTVSIRDKITYPGDSDQFSGWRRIPVAGSAMRPTERTLIFQKRYSFKSTNEIIDSFKAGQFPDKALITIHPQRWDDTFLDWTVELVSQNVKNAIKRFVINTDYYKS